MKLRIILNLIIIFTIIFYVYLIFKWHNKNYEINISYRSENLDNAQNRKIIAKKTNIGEFFEKFNEFQIAPEYVEEWPRFRGTNFDNIYKSKNFRLADKWNTDGPDIKWKQSLGEGYAAPVIFKGLVFVIDYIEELESDALRCFSLKDGKELWRRRYKVNIQRNHGKSRAVPAVNEKYIVSIGPKGHVMCVETYTGKLLWYKDMVLDYGSEIPQWYSGQCAYLENDIALLAVAGKEKLIVALNAATGEELWNIENKNSFKMSHTSIIKTKMYDHTVYVYAALGGIIGFTDLTSGKLLWSNIEWQPPVWAPSPVSMDNGKLFLTAGYGAGSAVLKIKYENEKWTAVLEKKWNPREGSACEQHTPLVYNNVLYTILPKDAGINRQLFVGMNTKDNKIINSADRDLRFGLGPYIAADDKFYILDDFGTLYMLKLENNNFKLLGKHKVLEGNESWGPLAIADGLMIARDFNSMVCIDLRK